MRKNKRLLFVLTVVVVLVAAGTAFASGGRRMYGRHGGSAHMGRGGSGYCFMEQGGRRYGCCGMAGSNRRGMGMYGGRSNEQAWTCPMRGNARAGFRGVPQDIRDKMREMQQTMADIGREWANNPINRERILELHAKRFSLAQEISEWCLNRRLDALEGE